MSGKKSDYVVKKYGLHEVAPLCPSNSEQRLIKKPENLWRETPIRKRKTK